MLSQHEASRARCDRGPPPAFATPPHQQPGPSQSDHFYGSPYRGAVSSPREKWSRDDVAACVQGILGLTNERVNKRPLDNNHRDQDGYKPYRHSRDEPFYRYDAGVNYPGMEGRTSSPAYVPRQLSTQSAESTSVPSAMGVSNHGFRPAIVVPPPGEGWSLDTLELTERRTNKRPLDTSEAFKACQCLRDECRFRDGSGDGNCPRPRIDGRTKCSPCAKGRCHCKPKPKPGPFAFPGPPALIAPRPVQQVLQAPPPHPQVYNSATMPFNDLRSPLTALPPGEPWFQFNSALMMKRKLSSHEYKVCQCVKAACRNRTEAGGTCPRVPMEGRSKCSPCSKGRCTHQRVNKIRAVPPAAALRQQSAPPPSLAPRPTAGPPPHFLPLAGSYFTGGSAATTRQIYPAVPNRATTFLAASASSFPFSSSTTTTLIAPRPSAIAAPGLPLQGTGRGFMLNEDDKDGEDKGQGRWGGDDEDDVEDEVDQQGGGDEDEEEEEEEEEEDEEEDIIGEGIYYGSKTQQSSTKPAGRQQRAAVIPVTPWTANQLTFVRSMCKTTTQHTIKRMAACEIFTEGDHKKTFDEVVEKLRELNEGGGQRKGTRSSSRGAAKRAWGGGGR